ncbi:hypothetical protein [Paenirhodobacter populi]|uniref:hypothetical protein n=1 Tax=Paenirhodobacter populi TaxID=2306993 RepID=UPI000FE3BBA5|nr:hypothetical protein [Sinirhodobacter populi]
MDCSLIWEMQAGLAGQSAILWITSPPSWHWKNYIDLFDPRMRLGGVVRAESAKRKTEMAKNTDFTRLQKKRKNKTTHLPVRKKK